MVLLLAHAAGSARAEMDALDGARAHAIVAAHIRYGYFPVHLNTSTYKWPQNAKAFNFMHSTLKKLAQRGLVEFTLDDGERMKTLSARLTPEGQQMPHAVFGPNRDIIGLLCGHRTLFEITERDPANDRVYFTYGFEPDELGAYLGSTPDANNLGRARIVFDSLRGDYVFRGFEYYSAQSRRWEMTSWAHPEEAPPAFYLGITR
jgi:hypothetical protein